MIYFTAHTFKCVCHCRRAMFRVLGMYNFAKGAKKQKSNAACLWDKSVINLRNGQWLLWAELKSSKLLLVWTLDKLFLIRPTHGSIAKLSNYDFIYKLKIYWVIMQWFYYKRSGFNTLLHDNLRAGWKIVQK